MPKARPKNPAPPKGSISEVFRAFLVLGFTSFGGPVAHIGFFRNAFVLRRKWLDDRAFADLMAMCQFLPGPASSQLGMSIGLVRAGVGGLLAAWTAFTAPSAILMIAFAYGVASVGSALGSGWLAGLKAAAVAVVAQAVINMARTLCPDRERATIALAAAAVTSLLAGAWGQILTLILGGLAGLVFVRAHDIKGTSSHLHVPVPRALASCSLALFAALLILLPLAATASGAGWLKLADSFYRVGSLVFGGGHVVLPLLDAETRGLIPHDQFLAGYGAAQALPGPLTTFSAYLGALMQPPPNGIAGAIIALLAIFLPSILLVVGALPFWWQWREIPAVRWALAGVNAAVVGLLGAALWNPVIPLGITNVRSFVIALAVYAAVEFWKIPPWAAVIAAAIAGFAAL
ncbi:MAG TPA: chromate efflux transporter [Xanthobacteraceae bacterium]|nr:chromate efflux transporter [Xanthobacteraceae bacterium]